MRELLAAIAKAESVALAEHLAGTCHLSQWSCSHCEAEDAGALSDAGGMRDEAAIQRVLDAPMKAPYIPNESGAGGRVDP